jgi:hypothetical protein
MDSYRNAQTLYTQICRIARLMHVSAKTVTALIIADFARRRPAEAVALVALVYGANYTLTRAGNIVHRRASNAARGARSLASRSVRGAASLASRSVRSVASSVSRRGRANN